MKTYRGVCMYMEDHMNTNEKRLWRVSYFYLASGMEGEADVRDYGLVAANSADEAIELIVNQEYPEELRDPHKIFLDIKDIGKERSRNFFRGCLSAK
jgi:hypothetical protein